MADRAADFKLFVERKAAPYAAAGMIVGMVARSAQIYSLGTFSIAALPPAARFFYSLLTGVCVAAGMELMFGAAGAKWWKLRERKTLVLFDASIPAKDRPAYAKLVGEKAKLYLYATIFAGLASFGAIVSFAFSGGELNIAAAAADTVIALVTIGGVGFFSIMYEPEQPDQLREAAASVNSTLMGQAQVVAGRISQGDYRPQDIAFLKRATRDPEMAHMLDALTPQQEVAYWDTPRIMQFLGLTLDKDARDIRRVLAKAKDDPTLGVREKEGRKGLEAPQTAILALFGDRIEQHIKTAIEGRSAASQRDESPVAGIAGGQVADIRRRVSGVSGPRLRRLAQLRARQA